MTRPLSNPTVLLLILAAALLGFVAGEVREARVINAEIEAAFALPVPDEGPGRFSF